jgi:hypothetical protein
MPLNLLKVYNQLLDIQYLDERKRKQSLMGVFDRDIANNRDFKFLGKQVQPTPANGKIEMATLFTHITTVMIDTITRERIFDIHRACRLHWIRFHIEQRKSDDMLIFSAAEPEGKRNYIYDKRENYVIVLEPL